MANITESQDVPATSRTDLLREGASSAEEVLVDRLLALSRRVEGDLERRSHVFELAPSAKQTLLVLGGLGSGAHQGELAKRVGRSAAAMTRIVDALADQRLVERVEHPFDRRCNIVRLTAVGRQTATTLDGEARRTASRALHGETSEDVGLFLTMLERIASRLA